MANESNILHFSNYNSIALYMCDYVDSGLRGGLKIVPLNSLGFGAHDTVKVKILQNAGMDIAKVDAKFVTDVELEPDLESFCKTIAPEEFRAKEVIKRRTGSRIHLKLVDYTQECYWALTSRLRGYQLQCTYVSECPMRQLVLRPIHKKKIEELLQWCIPINEEDDYWSDSTNDSVVGRSENSTSSVDDGGYLLATSDSDYSDTSTASSITRRRRLYSDEYMGYGYRPLDRTIFAVREKWLELMEKDRYFGLLIVEYHAGCNAVTSHSSRIVHNSLVIDFMDAHGSTSCSMVTMNSIHTSAWDVDLHCDEGVYHSCLDQYYRNGLFQGVVLMGEQNGGSTYSYATALHDNLIVPDLAD